MARRITLDFLKTETTSGAVLGLAALAALIVANSPWAEDYFAALKSYLPVSIGDFIVRLTITDWIKEGLMALFFLMGVLIGSLASATMGSLILARCSAYRRRRELAGRAGKQGAKTPETLGNIDVA